MDPETGKRTTSGRSRPSIAFPRTLIAAGLAAAAAAGAPFSGAESLPRLQVEPVRFPSSGAVLAGTIVSPPVGIGRHPAAAIVHGAGPDARAKYRPAADFLAARGFVVLVYDKRGTGESTGFYNGVSVDNSELVLSDLAADADAAVRVLAGRPDVDPRRVGLVGFSQAGWVVPLAASRSDDVSFMVLFSGATMSVGESILYEQLSGGAPDAPPRTLDDEQIERRLVSFGGPHGYDPHRSLQSVSVPGLWLLGGKDAIVPVARASSFLLRLASEERKPFTVKIYPQGDHALNDGSGSAYPFLRDAYAWLREQGLAPQD
jgi:dienelactone hydrolase